MYDRWGELVFDRKDFPLGDLSTGWDGSFRGKLLHLDVYVWYAQVLMRDGTIWEKSGDVLLYR